MFHCINKFFPLRSNIIFVSNSLIICLWLIFFVFTIIQVIKEQKLLTSINNITSSNKSIENEIAFLISQLKHDEYILSYYHIFTDDNNKQFSLTHSEVLDIILYPYHSDIIENLNELALIRSWLGNAALHLIYKSSLSGDSAKVFHQKVYEKSKLLFLIKATNGARFGGYTSQSFDGCKMLDFDLEMEKKDKEMFLFSLNHYTKYDIIKMEKALFCDESIIFGICSNEDFIIEDGFTKKECITNFPQCFQGDKYALTLGSKVFMIEEMEVFEVMYEHLK